ncbi:MAG: hypothetical protein ACJ8IK_20845 [Burkholderiaceae bacterium]
MPQIKPISAVSLVAAASLAAFAAVACGPDFEQLLIDRQLTLKAPVGVDFGRLARQFGAALQPAPKPPSAAASEALAAARTADDRDSAMARVEGLAQSDRIATLRSTGDGDAAFAAGADLPPVYRLYAAAAVDFQAGMPTACSDTGPEASTMSEASAPASASSASTSSSEEAPCVASAPEQLNQLRRAATRFEALLKLDAQTARPRAAWAAFSLGRVRRQLGEPDAAVAAFRLTRQRVAQGASDPLQLATASLGEEARVELERGDVARAVTLYDEQAASGGADADVAVQSLQQVAARVFRSGRYKDAIADPASRRLLVTWLLAVGVPPDEPAPVAEGAASTATQAPAASPAADRMGKLLDAIASVGTKHGPLQDADRVAALAYQAGRYPAATRFAALSHSPLALWIQAKLALRAGDQERAASLYAQAVGAMAGSSQARAAALDGGRLVAEDGTIRLTRGDFVQSLELWWSVGDRYWMDLAYVAERVVTTDELKAFVDAHVPAGAPLTTNTHDDEFDSHADDPTGQLRDLLARRLMRDGRIDEAMGYFHDPDKRWPNPRARAQAVAYRHAMSEARAASSPIERARHTFAAARLVRADGLDLFGYELSPDAAVMQGNFEFQEQLPAVGPQATADEAQRVHATAAVPPGRFHYRGRAALLAEKAADDLPPRSQAYAAVLCHAVDWTRDRQPEMAKAIYKRYIRKGAVFAWASHFGTDCPEPDFRHAR